MDQSPRATATVEYAALHRRAESGLATDDTWRRLAAVCVELGKRKEAADALQHIQDASARRGVQREFVKLGWVRSRNETVSEADLRLTPVERLRDAAAFLLDGRALWLTLLLTLTFPLVMAVGGMFGRGDVLVTGAATLAALCTCGVLGALARHVFRLGLREVQDPEELPTLPRLLLEAPRAVVELGSLAALATLPAAIAFRLGAWFVAWPWLLLAALFLPMAAAQLFAGARWRELRVTHLFTATLRTRASYPAVAGLAALLLAPSVFAFIATVDTSVFIALSLAGPLFTTPFLLVARMLGLTMRYEREPLGDLAAPLVRATAARRARCA